MVNTSPLKIVDVNCPERLSGGPTKTVSLLETHIKFRECVIKKIELRLYAIKNVDDSLITAFVDTDKGSVETTYDEGSRCESLEDAQKFLNEHLGLSSLILRCILTLESELSKGQPDL